LQAPTCLPCHCFYAATGIFLAESLNADSLAFGYTGYQSDWPEQTPYAIECLTRIIASRRIHFLLPVIDIVSKIEAVAELARYHLSTEALEQKCSQQQSNTSLEFPRLKEEIAAWEKALHLTLEELDKKGIEVIAESFFSNLDHLD
jgi:hypothetical protein